MPASRPGRLRLFDILDCIASIDRVAAKVRSGGADYSIEQWRATERWLEIISEASRHIPADWKAQEPAIPWRQIADIGNLIRHSYDRLDMQTLKEIVEDDLPALREAAERLYGAHKLAADPWP